MTVHINANPGDYSSIVLMPGDPLRAQHIANTFLSQVVQVNSVRNNLGFTGFYKQKLVSVQASGMGQPSLGIYATELFSQFGIQKIIRIGTCGSLSPQVHVGDIVVAMSAATDSNYSQIVPRFSLSPCCSFNMLESFVKSTGKKNLHIGQITSNDAFYQEDTDWYSKLAKYGVLAVDMETHVLYFIAAKFNRQALSVNLVSDSLVNNEQEMTSYERTTQVDEITERVLETLL